MRKMMSLFGVVLLLGSSTEPKPPQADIDGAKTRSSRRRRRGRCLRSDSLRAQRRPGRARRRAEAQEDKFAMFRSYSTPASSPPT